MTTSSKHNYPTDIILGFFGEIGLPYLLEPVENGAFMPGISLKNGVVVIDTERLLYPGDLLHEAGHVATMPPSGRHTMNGMLGKTSDMEQASEIIAQAWSYAACIHLDLDPALVFHEAGYRGSAKSLIDCFGSSYPPGVSMLEYYSMAYTAQQADLFGVKPFPYMVNWINQTPIEEVAG